MNKKKVFIVAEAGVNHNGSLDVAMQLALQAKEAGADAVKYQTFITEKIMVKDAPSAKYQVDNTNNSNQFNMIKKLELTYHDFTKIKQYCDLIGIEFMSTPDDEDSMNFLVDEIGVKIIKIGSGEITNIPFLRKIGQTGKDVILSTGMSTIDEVANAINNLRQGGVGEITLLHCTTNYPTNPDEVNLNAMLTLKKKFNLGVGYSDHTIGDSVAIAATAMGASIIEKHFTLDNEMSGPDQRASMNPEDFRLMVKKIRNIEKALGNGVKEPTKSEIQNAIVVRRSIVAAQYIKAGETFCERNLTCKRPSTGLSPTEWDNVIGKIAYKNFQKDELIMI